MELFLTYLTKGYTSSSLRETRSRHRRTICAICSPSYVPLWCVRSFDSQEFVSNPGTAPIAYPVAKILDRALGVHDTHTYKKAELKSFLQFHRTGKEPLRDDEIGILNGVLELSSKNVEMIMTPICVSISDISFWWAQHLRRVFIIAGCCHVKLGYNSRPRHY